MSQSTHISSLFGAKGTTICLKSEKWGKQGFRRQAKTRKICSRLAHFSLRFFKSDRLLDALLFGFADMSVFISVGFALIDARPAGLLYIVALIATFNIVKRRHNRQNCRINASGMVAMYPRC
jgi:hypothetical protein